MRLPIDLLPNGPHGQLRFRWSQTVDTIVGVKVVEHEGALDPSVERAVADLIEMVKCQTVEIENRRADMAKREAREGQNQQAPAKKGK